MQEKRIKEKHSYKRIYVDFDPDVREIIVNELSGKLGKRPPDVVKTIVRIYLSERGYFRLGCCSRKKGEGV